MEILAFIVVAVVGIVIYHNLPQTKFNKAIKLMESGDLELALERFINIKEKHDEAIVKIAEIKYKLTESMLTSSNTEKVVAEYQSILNLRKELHRPNFDNNGLSAIEKKTRQAINETYYQHALELLKKGKKEAAVKELEKLKERHSLAGLKIAQIKLQDAKKLLHEDREKALVVFKEVLDIRKGIVSMKVNTTKFNSIESEAREAITLIYYDKGKNYYESNQLDLATDSFKKSLEWVISDKVRTNCLIALSETAYKKGTQYEKRRNFKQAVSHYETALTYIDRLYKNDFFYNIQGRIEICGFKQRKKPSEEIIHFLLDKNFSSKNDLMFRYALLLAKKGGIQACENILDTQFKMSNNSEVKKLRRFCIEYYQKKALEKMTWVDEVIFNRENKNSSHISKIYHDFDNIKSVILKGFPELSNKVEKIKPYLFSRLISQYFEGEEFEKIVHHISAFEAFYDKPELLKNIGIACLRLANNQELTMSNYQKVISTWLTAVYSDNVILNSLEVTEWDDEYTFTLIDSIGSKYRFENDVENVNFEAATKDNISIGDVQRQLVAFFENALNHISDDSLAQKAQLFYQLEKEAIEKIIEVIDTQIIYATPYFAKQHNLQDVILEHLVLEFENSQDLSILSIGNLYVKNKKPAIFKNYSTAKKMIENCINAVENLDSNALNKQNTSKNVNALQYLPKLKKQLEHDLVSAFSRVTQDNEGNVNIIYLFESAIQILPNSANLKRRCADFTTNLTISKVNGGAMSNIKALKYMIKAYELNATNHRTVNNLAIIAKFNCMDMLNGVSNDSMVHLKKLIEIKNSLLTQSLRNELADVFNGIMEQIRQNDPEVVVLFEKKIFNRSVSRSPFGELMSTRSPLDRFNTTSLNSAGEELAEKLRVIYQLINEDESPLSNLLKSFLDDL